MKTYKFILKTSLLFALISVFYISDLHAQRNRPPGPPAGVPPGPPAGVPPGGGGENVPIDGGAALLLAAGAAYGIKKMKDSRGYNKKVQI